MIHQRWNLLLLFWLMAVFVTLCPDSASAQTCTLSATPAAFGVYDPTSSTPTDIMASITMKCQATVAISLNYGITLSTGLSNMYTNRQMSASPYLLNYQLYRDPARSQVWGDGTSGTYVVSSIYVLVANIQFTLPLTVYGRIPALQNAAAGTYTDSILVTLTF